MWQLSNREKRGELATAASSIFYCSASCRVTGSLAEQVAGDIDYGKTSPFFCLRFKIRLHKNLDGLFAGINLDTHRRVPKINFVPAAVHPSDNRMRHFFTTSVPAS